MVNRVFSYSEEVAKNNNNKFGIGRMILEIFGLVMLLVLSIFIIMPLTDGEMSYLFLFVLAVWIVLIIIYCIKTSSKLKAGLMGLATDTENNVYLAIKLNNGEEFVLGGMAVDTLLDNLASDGNSMLGAAFEVAGAAMSLYTINKSINIMKNPIIISKMVEFKETLTGGVVWKILKVHNIVEDAKKYVVNCDYQIMKNKKIKCNKKITIYKVYNSCLDLKNILEGKR